MRTVAAPLVVLVLWPALVIGGMYVFWVVPVLGFRFSLRTLLIATTLVAVMLGLIVWLMRSGE
jgi:hypothetical protein